MPTFNGEKFIESQLLSILNQLSEHDEVIISDDSSTDRTVAIIENINDRRIQIIKSQSFKSPIFNLENALNFCSGDIIFLSDQDDIWHASKVERMLMLLEKHDLVVSNCDIINENGDVISSSFFELNGSRKGIFHNFLRNGYLGCCMAFKRQVLKYALPFPKKIPMHDIWFGFVAGLFFNPYFTDDKLISYRRHGSNASPTSDRSQYTLMQKIGFRLELIKQLPRLCYKRFCS